MAQITTGLLNNGLTTHFKFTYDDSLALPGGPEPVRTNAVIAECENDFAVICDWFSETINITGISIQITENVGLGAKWHCDNIYGSDSFVFIKDPQGKTYRDNPAYFRYLLISEVTEIFMMVQNTGWFQNQDEGSKGEGLSRFLGGQFLAMNGFLSLGILDDSSIVHLWLNSSREDYINNAPDDNQRDAINGCTTLFLYYLSCQLGYTAKNIVAAGAQNLAGVYKNLSNDNSDPFPIFKALIDHNYPTQMVSAIPAPNYDNPFPLEA